MLSVANILIMFLFERRKKMLEKFQKNNEIGTDPALHFLCQPN